MRKQLVRDRVLRHHGVLRIDQLEIVFRNIGRVPLDVADQLVALDAERHVPVRAEDDRIHFRRQKRSPELAGPSDHDLHFELGIVPGTKGAQPEFRQVQHNRRTRGIVRKPPPALQGQLQLANAEVERRVQLRERRLCRCARRVRVRGGLETA